ncbi:flagellar hook-associated protein FlgL [Microbulbifer thermotolerans]|uniref:flagellar hook-associated protein FlgL n=1 Tax=Microbulbifer thermotolerans TaxID=252514 RepID=UPI002248B937|nr:flagellar hook-associated protein FlgL [Microbulbifer thermotolerans]MCX2795876.1 flagellar hook-associated protein FlgL [Microbulbifer thermotolerans]
MRISTVTVYEQSMSSMNRQQGEFLKVGQQIASGRRVVNPSDDPQAASQAVQVSQSLAITEQYTDARVSARNALSQEESILNGVSDAIASAKTLIVQAASDTLSDEDRVSVASELRGIYETLIGQANATDGNGRYLFGGYQDDSAPFVRSGTGNVIYVADNNSREVRIDASRLMPVADNGIEVFQSVTASAGYVAEADSANTGSVTFKGPNVVDETDPGYGGAFDITFSVVSGTATYSINGGAPQPYASGQALSFGGLTMILEGEPADGDRITVDLAQNMNTDLFATFEKALSILEQPASTDSEKAARANTLNTVMREFDNSLDNVLTVRASVGARLNELDVVDSVAANRTLNYQQELSDLVDLDYVEAIAEYSLRQVGLQAAQQAFVDIISLSLFDRL